MANVAKRTVPYDPTVYPSEDHMGEGSLQRFISELFRALLERWLAARGAPTFVGANQFIYWTQFNPKRSIAPDVFVLPGVKPGIKIDSWKTWEHDVAPSFALEVVSQDEYLKDYRDGPPSYDDMGVQELVILDPEYRNAPADRLLFQVYRRLPKRGLVRVEATNDDRVRSRVLGCHLRAVGADLDTLRLRLATGPKGDVLFPTAEEAERAAQATAEAARVTADAEIAQLRAEIERLRGKKGKLGAPRATGAMSRATGATPRATGATSRATYRTLMGDAAARTKLTADEYLARDGWRASTPRPRRSSGVPATPVRVPAPRRPRRSPRWRGLRERRRPCGTDGAPGADRGRERVVTVTVRDEGVGMRRRLAEAVGLGRSAWPIHHGAHPGRGWYRDDHQSAGAGTKVEMRVPR